MTHQIIGVVVHATDVVTSKVHVVENRTTYALQIEGMYPSGPTTLQTADPIVAAEFYAEVARAAMELVRSAQDDLAPKAVAS